MEAEIRVMLPQDRDAPETGRSNGEFSLEPLEGVWHADTLSLNSGLQNCGRIISILSHRVCGDLSWQPEETSTSRYYY